MTARYARIGRHRVRWLDAPHLPHGWECGYLFEETTATLLCGDLFTQPGPGAAPLDPRRYSFAQRRIPPSDGLLLPTRPRPRVCWPSLPRPNRSVWPACMAAPGKATGRRCLARWARAWRADSLGGLRRFRPAFSRGCRRSRGGYARAGSWARGALSWAGPRGPLFRSLESPS